MMNYQSWKYHSTFNQPVCQDFVKHAKLDMLMARQRLKPTHGGTRIVYEMQILV